MAEKEVGSLHRAPTVAPPALLGAPINQSRSRTLASLNHAVGHMLRGSNTVERLRTHRSGEALRQAEGSALVPEVVLVERHNVRGVDVDVERD